MEKTIPSAETAPFTRDDHATLENSHSLAAAGAPLPDCLHQRVLDAHGRDPADYEWLPVLKKPRADGWSPEKQRNFIAVLADTGSVRTAARSVCMSAQSAYALRRSVAAESFSAAWDAAIAAASKSLIDVAMDRALNGADEAVYDRDGNVIAYRTKFNDRLLMFMLRAHSPERYRGAHRDGCAADEGMGSSAQPVADALAMLDPVPPEAPHKLMSSDALDAALETAEILDGKLSHRHRDRDILREEYLEEAANTEQAPLVPGISTFDPKSAELIEMLTRMKKDDGDGTRNDSGEYKLKLDWLE